MRCHKRSRGQTLPLVIVLTLVVILLGICFCGLMKTVGGCSEHQNATDSGVLNLNKQAIVQGIPFDTQSDFQTDVQIVFRTFDNRPALI